MQREIATSLKTELDAFRVDFMAKASPEVREAMACADAELAASGIAQRALKAGDRVPDFRLPDVRGDYVRLSELLAKGPVVVSFYRGGWCPYCNLELRALQKALPEITRLGAQLVAVSPQTPDESLSTAEKNQLTFAVLSDVGSVTAKAFGIAFDIAEELRPLYPRFGHALPDKNGDESWVLPIPATYVIDRNRTVALAGRGVYLSVVNREKFKNAAHLAYEAVLPDPATRLLTSAWPRWIPFDQNARAFDRFRWLEEQLSQSRLPTLIIWGREDDVFDATVFSQRFKQLLPHAEGPHLVTGRHFLQEDSGPEIAALIVAFLDRLDQKEATFSEWNGWRGVTP